MWYIQYNGILSIYEVFDNRQKFRYITVNVQLDQKKKKTKRKGKYLNYEIKARENDYRYQRKVKKKPVWKY